MHATVPADSGHKSTTVIGDRLVGRWVGKGHHVDPSRSHQSLIRTHAGTDFFTEEQHLFQVGEVVSFVTAMCKLGIESVAVDVKPVERIVKPEPVTVDVEPVEPGATTKDFKIGRKR